LISFEIGYQGPQIRSLGRPLYSYFEFSRALLSEISFGAFKPAFFVCNVPQTLSPHLTRASETCRASLLAAGTLLRATTSLTRRRPSPLHSLRVPRVQAACAARAGAAAGLGAMAAARVARDDAPGGLVDVGSVAEVTIPPVAAGLCSSLSVPVRLSSTRAPPMKLRLAAARFGSCVLGGGGVVQRFRPRHQHQVFERYRLGFEFCRAAIHPSPCACTRRSGGRQSSDTGGAAGVARLASLAIDSRSRDPPTHHSHLRLLTQGSLEFCRRLLYRAPGMEVRRGARGYFYPP
jgi:hypothetical protein